MLGPALPPLSPPVEGASAAVVGQNDDVQPVAQLISYAWSGTGQVKMFYSGRDTWQKDNPWDTNDTTPTATGPKQPAWHLDDPQGDPEDFIANSTPTLTAVFSVSPTDPKAGSQRIKTLQVEAKNLNTEGVALDFNSATVVVPLYVTRITVTLTTNDTVGNQISNSFVLLEWKESINGMTAQPDPVTPTTHQQLFVTYGNPLNPSLNPPTAARVYYATDLAQGITHSNILAVSATIGRDAMSSARWNVNAPGNYTYASAWKVLEPNGNGGTCRRRIVAHGRRFRRYRDLVASPLCLSAGRQRLLQGKADTRLDGVVVHQAGGGRNAHL